MGQPGLAVRAERRLCEGNTARDILIAILVLAAMINLAWFAKTSSHTLVADEITYNNLATHWMHDKVGMSMDGKEPSAFVGPIYPGFLVIVYSVLGQSPKNVYLVQILFGLISLIVIYKIGIRLTSRRLPSLLACLAIAGYFPLFMYNIKLNTESIFTLQLALSVLLIMVALERQRARWFALAGISTGLAALCRPSLIPIPGIIFLILFVWYRKDALRSIAWFVLFVVMLILTMSPWTIRNYMVWKTFVPVATEGGWVMWSGNYGKYGDFSFHNQKAPAELERFLKTNPSEVEKNQYYTREAIKEIKANPAHFAGLAVRKFTRLWFNVGYRERPSKASLAIMFLHMAVILLAAFSVRSVANKSGLALILLTVAMFTALHMITVGVVRYSAPLMPYMFILSATGFCRFFGLQKCEKGSVAVGVE